MKTCNKCNLEKPETDFYLQSAATGKRNAACKECISSQQKVYRKENPEKIAAYLKENQERISARDKVYRKENQEKISARMKGYRKENRKERAAWDRFNLYKVTPDDYKRLIANQGGKCAICEKEIKLCVDHDHKTGKVRGLLCGNCNGAIGFLKDSSDIARRATKYLEQHGN